MFRFSSSLALLGVALHTTLAAMGARTSVFGSEFLWFNWVLAAGATSVGVRVMIWGTE